MRKVDSGGTGRCLFRRAACGFAALPFALALSLAWAAAQEPSTDRRSPTPLTSNTVEGEYDGEATVHYYRFVANKGEVKTVLTAQTQRYSVNVDVELLDENYRQIEKLWVTANEAGRTETNVHRFVRRQPVILKVSLPADKDIKHLKYEIELSGAVEFDGGASSGGGIAHGNYRDGYQLVPVNWGINTPTKQGFFHLLKEITGA